MKVLLSVIFFLIILRVGIGWIRSLGPLPPPPPAGELRKVNLRYRCSICGTEVKMVMANDEVPEPPKHCQDEMQLVAPVIE